MKKTLPSILLLALALVIAFGSATFLGPCVHADGSFGPCHWAGRGVTGLGGLLAVLAALALAMPEKSGLYLAMVPTCALGFLTPGTLIDLCGTATMRCRMVMQPSVRILFALSLAVALIGFILTRGRAKA